MISPPLRSFWQDPAHADGATGNGFAKRRKAAQHGPMAAKDDAPSHPIPTPSLDWRPGLFAGPCLCPAAARSAADRQGFAHARPNTGFCNGLAWWFARSTLESGAITTPDGGSISCVKPRSFLPFWPLRPWPAVCRPMANAPLPVPPPVRSSRMRPIAALSPALQSAALPAPSATISTCPAACRATDPRRIRQGRAEGRRALTRGPGFSNAIGAAAPVAFVFAQQMTSDIKKAGGGTLAPEGRD